MRRNRMHFGSAAALIMIGATVATATEWVADFTGSGATGWANSDFTSIAHYTDTVGGNANSFTVTFPTSATSDDVVNVPAGWLTQGSRGSVPTTARFFNAPGSINGRARFSTALPTSMNANEGVAVAWTAKYGSYAMTRAPIQIAVTESGDPNVGEFNIYIRVQNGTSIAIRNNNGDPYTGLDALTVANIADGNYHQWSCSVITSGGTAHWKLWLDGTQLLFANTNGQHTFDPGTGSQTFSFQTVSNGFSGAPYIGLGELSSSDQWDFEFDCVAYKDDGLADNFTCGSTAPPCDSNVSPLATQTSAALKGTAATPATFVYTFTNSGSGANGYTVAETDASGTTAQDYPWLTLTKAGEPTVTPGGTDQVSANITDTNLTAGPHTAYITFTHTCTPTIRHTRRIDLTITDCASTVWPAGEAARSITLGSVGSIPAAVFTLTNTGRDGLTYNVQEEAGGCSWLTLDKSGGGPLANGQTDTVTATIDATGLAVGVHTCSLRFTNTTPGCTNAPADHVRTVVLNILGPAAAREQFVAEFTTFTGSDEFSHSPVVSCDPNVLTAREFFVPGGNPLQVTQLDPGWLTQGTIEGDNKTARFNNPPGPGSGFLTGVGRARFQTFLPFGTSFDPVRGFAVAWRMRIGNYSPTRGPVQITFPRVAGPFGTSDTLAIPGDVFNAYIRIQNGTNVSILRNGGGQFAGINTLVLPTSIADAYHQWTAAVCYNADEQMAYWNLWIDGQKLLFSGADGSPTGPADGTFSFRTSLEDVGGDPYIGLGEQQTSIDIWDFEFDWVRMLTYNVFGCPFWDGEGCVPAPLCNTPFADADEDHDVDMDDFGAFQICYTGSGPPPGAFDADNCKCFDRNNDQDVDGVDFQRFTACATGANVLWQPGPLCP